MLTKTRLLLLAFCACLPLPAAAQETGDAYNVAEQTRQLAFDPIRFFPDRHQMNLFLSIRYTGDDSGYPVYSIGVRKGCTPEDIGEARRTCGNRLTARMVRLSLDGERASPRMRGRKLISVLSQISIADDAGLKRALDAYGLEWLEADVTNCAPAMEHLRIASELRFFPTSPLPNEGEQLAIYLHADKVELLYGDYLERVRYFGMLKKDNPGGWADGFATSLETCWSPATALTPWSAEA